MDIVPVSREYDVVHCAEDETLLEESPEVQAWIKRSTLNQDNPFVIWAKGGYETELAKLYPDLPTNMTNAFRQCGIVKGWALLSPSITIHTAGGNDLPKYLWRTTHSGQPFGGMKPRSSFGTNAAYFSIHFKMHCSWTCRQPSPFMSWSSNVEKALRVAARYEAKGFKGIKISRVRTRGAAWNYERQRIWNVEDLVQTFGYIHTGSGDYRGQEFIIEHSVPSEYTKTFDWDDEKDKIDFRGDLRDEYVVKAARQQYQAAKKRRKAERVRKQRRAMIRALAEEKNISLEEAERMSCPRKTRTHNRTFKPIATKKQRPSS